MERQIPKNVRQIGNVSDTPKIYVEDYVDTFFNQLCEKAGENPVGAFLVGDLVKSEEEEYVYIYGAIQMHELKMSGTEYVLDEETWKAAYEDCKQYFEDGEMLGWFVAHAGVPLTAESSTEKLHKKSFPKENTIFIIKDPTEREEMYYVHKLNELMEVGGHFTYYEKNPSMQNYMICARKKNGVCPSETVEDRAAKDFRSLVRSRGEQKSQRQTNRLMYAMSACLVLLVVVMGVVTMNNFDRMKAVQSVIDGMGEASASEKEPEKVVETGGNVLAVEEPEADVGEGLQGNTEKRYAEVDENGGNNDRANVSGQQSEQTDVGGQQPGPTDTDVPVGERGEESDGIYVVESGDTLAMISQKMYGDISHIEAISKMNGLMNGDLIYVGQKLILP